MNKKKYDMNGYTLYHIKNKKFKNIIIGAYFLKPVDVSKIVESALLARMMSKFNKKYPSELLFSKYLESNYGMALNISNNKEGLVNKFNISVKYINDSFLKEDVNLTSIAIDTLITTIKDPLFDKDLFNLEKELLIDDIERAYDNKNKYASIRFVEEMYKDEAYSHTLTSSLKNAREVTLDSVIAEYQTLLKSKKVFYVIGDLDEKDVINLFKNITFDEETKLKLEFKDLETKEIIKVNEVIEKANYKQSIVYMGYRCEIRVDDELYPAMFVLDYMLGGYFNSTLIEEIREKRSLAYSVYSSYYSNKGSFIITGGISSSEYEEFKKVSISIINDYKKGIIDDENFTNAKKILVNAQYRAADEMNYGMAEIIKEISGGIMRTTEEKVDIIKNVTKEEIIKAANMLKLDTIYMLEGSCEDFGK